MASACEFAGNGDMYGLGIRIAFYLQWFGTIAAGWLARTEVPGLRLANEFFIAATFLALIIQAAANAATLRALDVYLALLLTYGAYYGYVPIYAWRIVSGCSPFWDPTRWPRVRSTDQYKVMHVLLLLAVTCYQLWFWTTGIDNLGSGLDPACREYGFFFAAVPLRSKGFVAANIIFAIALLVCCSFSLCLLVRLFRPPRWLRKKERRFTKKLERGDLSDETRWNLQVLLSLSNVTVASIVTAATELTIKWNHVTGVDDVSTAGQTIPVIIAAGLLAHVVYVYFYPEHDAAIFPEDKDKYEADKGWDPPNIHYGPPDPFFAPPAMAARPAFPRDSRRH